MVRILVCDDERDIVSALKIYLEAEGYTVLTAYDAREALDLLAREDVQLAILDVMMPGLDGISALGRLRQFSNIPVLLLTAKSEDADKIIGLNAGADDYITKPFNPVELAARVRANLRRYTKLGGQMMSDELTVNGLTMSLRSKEVTVWGESVVLTPTEYDILRFFMEHPGQVFSPKEIYESVWKEKFVGGDGTVAVHIRHIREKIEIDPGEPRYIKAVWGQGYKLCADGEEKK